MRFANSEFPATECGLEFWNTLTTQALLPLRKPIYDLHSHTLHSTIKYELLVIVTREHTKMIQAHTNYSYFQLPSSSPAGSSSMPCQDMYIKGHQSNTKTSFFFFAFPSHHWWKEFFAYLHQFINHSLSIDPARVQFSPAGILQIILTELVIIATHNHNDQH